MMRGNGGTIPLGGGGGVRGPGTGTYIYCTPIRFIVFNWGCTGFLPGRFNTCLPMLPSGGCSTRKHRHLGRSGSTFRRPDQSRVVLGVSPFWGWFSAKPKKTAKALVSVLIPSTQAAGFAERRNPVSQVGLSPNQGGFRAPPNVKLPLGFAQKCHPEKSHLFRIWVGGFGIGTTGLQTTACTAMP